MMFKFRVQTALFLFAALPVCIVGCGGTSEETAPAEETATPAATGTPAPDVSAEPAVVASATGSSGLSGKVLFEGTPPERAVLETEGDPKCAAMHASEPLLSDREVVSADGGVQWAFVYVKNPPAGDYPVPEEEAVLDQLGCRYTPHVFGVRTGQKVSIRNSDALLHNVRAIARANKPVNYGQPAGSPPRIKVFDKAEMEVRLKCDVHPWMTAFAFVMDHPFFAVTDQNGQFTIANLPSGNYTLGLWHEAYGEQEMSVSVKGGESTEVTFAVKPAGE